MQIENQQLTHWKSKLTDVNWIGTHVLPDSKDITVTLLKVEWVEKAIVMGQAKPTFVAYFAENPYFSKPMLLNKTNLKRITKITGTAMIQKWTALNIKVVLCQEMDKAIGGGKDWALRIKQYIEPVAVTDDQALLFLSKCNTLTDLQMAWDSLTAEEKKFPSVMAKKEELKKTLK